MRGKIDLNSARVEEIAELGGIDRDMALKLTDHRDRCGGIMGWYDVEKLLGARTAERLQQCFVIEHMDRPESAV